MDKEKIYTINANVTTKSKLTVKLRLSREPSKQSILDALQTGSYEEEPEFETEDIKYLTVESFDFNEEECEEDEL